VLAPPPAPSQHIRIPPSRLPRRGCTHIVHLSKRHTKMSGETDVDAAVIIRPVVQNYAWGVPGGGSTSLVARMANAPSRSCRSHPRDGVCGTTPCQSPSCNASAGRHRIVAVTREQMRMVGEERNVSALKLAFSAAATGLRLRNCGWGRTQRHLLSFSAPALEVLSSPPALDLGFSLYGLLFRNAHVTKTSTHHITQPSFWLTAYLAHEQTPPPRTLQ
jgi:hypothetical protein